VALGPVEEPYSITSGHIHGSISQIDEADLFEALRTVETNDANEGPAKRC
jgi:hypothetical protein